MQNSTRMSEEGVPELIEIWVLQDIISFTQQLQLVALELGTSGFQIRHPNHSTMLPPINKDLATAIPKTQRHPYRCDRNM